MIYKVINAQEMREVRELWDYCFEKKDTPFFQYYFNEYCGKDNLVVGGFNEVGKTKKLRTMLHLNPYVLRLRGREQQVPYIVGVATAPEARGQHLFAPLLQKALELALAQKSIFVILMPINAGIYLPYEFSFYCYRHAYKMPMSQLVLPKAGSDLPVEHVELNAELLAPIYARVTAAWNGVAKRSDFQWHKLLQVSVLENTQCAVVYRDDAAVGYMLYTLADETFNVVELLADDFAAQNRLLRYAAQHKSEAREFSWLATQWDKTYLYFSDQNLTGKLAPFMMARCLDARAALLQLPLGANLPEGELVVVLKDKALACNNHRLLLRTALGKLEVVNTTLPEDVSMDMGVFTQLYFGTFSATELWEAGKLQCTQAQKLAILDKLLPKQRNYINEYF